MYSITIEERGHKVKEIARVKTSAEANKVVEALRFQWQGTKKGRKSQTIGLSTIMRWSDGKMASLVVVDPLFPADGITGDRAYAKKGGAA